MKTQQQQKKLLAIDSFWHQLYDKSQKQSIDKKAIAAVQFNHCLDRTASVDSSAAQWIASPAAGVVRILLERDGGEKTTRATSLVAYQPNSQFASHSHPKGEEFVVLAGTFSDENGDYPAGTYVRNPPGSSHSPFSRDGCLIFVKLQQFLESDLQSVVDNIDFTSSKVKDEHWQTLFDDAEHGNDVVSFYQTKKETNLSSSLIEQGVEILVLTGEISTALKKYKVGHWLRLPPNTNEKIKASANTLLWIKTNHLKGQS